MGFTDEVRRATDAMHQRIFAHPFVTGIGDGTLPLERFRFYVRQDYVFLVQYSRVLALAVAKAPDLESMGKLAQLLHETLNTEMALHRGYCARLGIGEAELEATEAAPTTVAYTTFLLDVAARGTFGETVAALLPCQWGYCEIGERLASQGEPADAPLYAEWVRMYSSAEFRQLADWARGLADRLAAQAGPDERRRMAEAYATSTRYEYMFWEMAYRLEQWPV
ncbi:MAG: thiaminase II [Chloroflexi bacterium]|nr:thiaminase II [Chloroflexota bacterium]